MGPGSMDAHTDRNLNYPLDLVRVTEAPLSAEIPLGALYDRFILLL